jgi:cell division protein FtsL
VFSGLKNSTEKIEKFIENNKKEKIEMQNFFLKNNFVAKNSTIEKIFEKNLSYETINNSLAILNAELFYNFYQLNFT